MMTDSSWNWSEWIHSCLFFTLLHDSKLALRPMHPLTISSLFMGWSITVM
jgi:hypothetical protein